MSVATVQKLGEALVVVLPLELQEELKLSEGSALEMEAHQCDPNAPVSDEDRAWDAMMPVGRKIN